MLADDGLDLFEMANLYPRNTGLPMTVWISPRGGAKHDARVKVNTVHGASMDISRAVTVAIRPAPHETHGQLLTSADFAAVKKWIELNEKALIDFWDGKIDTAEVLGRLIKV
jgi:hypothetical protein